MYVPSKESQKCLPFDEITKALDSREKLSTEAQQQDYARICAVNKIYAIPHDEMDGVLERIYNQYLAAYNAMSLLKVNWCRWTCRGNKIISPLAL